MIDRFELSFNGNLCVFFKSGNKEYVTRSYVHHLRNQLVEGGGSRDKMEEVEQLCDAIGFIDQGKVVEHGPMQEVLARHHHSSIYVEGKQVTAEVLQGFPSLKEQGAGFSIVSDEPLETLEQLARSFASQAVLPERLELSQARLEDIFIRLTKTSLRDTGMEEAS